MADSNGTNAISRERNRRFRDKVSKQWLAFAGNCEPVKKYLAKRSYNSSWAPLKFLDALFRGYGQVVFANNPFSGFLIFIAITVADPLISASALLTSSVALLTSIIVVPQSPEMISEGLTVFNSLLIGQITASLLPAHYGLDLEGWHWIFMIIASIICVYVTSAFANILGAISQYPLPVLTVPFNIVQPLLFLVILNVNTINSNESALVTPHHVTLQSEPLGLSSIISVDIFNRTSHATTDISLPAALVSDHARKDMEENNFARIVNEDVISSSTAKVLMNANENFGIENSGGIKPNSNMKNNSNTSDKADIVGTEAGVDDALRENTQLNAEDEKEIITDDEKLETIDEKHDPVNTASTSVVSTETSRNLSSDTSNKLTEGNNLLDDDTTEEYDVRAKRSVPVDHNHQNDTQVEEAVVDWGGVFAGVLLSMSQVFALNYAPSAALMYLAVLIYSPIMAAFAVLGALLGTLTGLILTDIDTYDSVGGIYDGTPGFNAVLSTMCLGGLFFIVNWSATLAAAFCSIFSTIIFNVMVPPFARGGLVPLSLPFNLSALLFLCATSSGFLVRPKSISFPEKHRQEYQQCCRSRGTQDNTPPTSDINDKDSEMEKKPSLAEVV
ncbi:uncharacterized protein [Periplaneta americana]|uniref:uncharacterized protein n=1 Tax=Periplaneta americana TaxID=6978 RepID=UPI0037E7AC0D